LITFDIFERYLILLASKFTKNNNNFISDHRKQVHFNCIKSNSWTYPIILLFSGCCCCTFQRFKILAIPLVFSVGLVAADIFSDIATAQRLVSRGNIYWGLLTGILIIAPFLARLVLYLVSLSRCFKVAWSEQKFFGIRKILKIKKIPARLTFWRQELKQIWWHIPLLLPLRCVYLCYILNSNV
jgi:hypothetical protein